MIRRPQSSERPVEYLRKVQEFRAKNLYDGDLQGKHMVNCDSDVTTPTAWRGGMVLSGVQHRESSRRGLIEPTPRREDETTSPTG